MPQRMNGRTRAARGLCTHPLLRDTRCVTLFYPFSTLLYSFSASASPPVASCFFTFVLAIVRPRAVPRRRSVRGARTIAPVECFARCPDEKSPSPESIPRALCQALSRALVLRRSAGVEAIRRATRIIPRVCCAPRFELPRFAYE